MSDLVINHISSQSEWFKNFLKDKGKGKDYFLIVDKKIDLNKVFRPRANDIKKPVKIVPELNGNPRSFTKKTSRYPNSFNVDGSKSLKMNKKMKMAKYCKTIIH